MATQYYKLTGVPGVERLARVDPDEALAQRLGPGKTWVDVPSLLGIVWVGTDNWDEVTEAEAAEIEKRFTA